jgi:site-specific recombinase XerD
MTPIAPHISAFLQDYLAIQRGASQHTCDTYAYSFKLLFEYASQRERVPPSALSLEQIDAPLVAGFLEHLETDRGNTASTRNVRLAAIKSFFHFLEYRLPAALEQIRRVLAIPLKKTDSKLVGFLEAEEMQAVLDAPEPRTRDGIRDRAMLHLASTAGLRVSELTGLRVDELTLEPTPSILVRGKGRKQRTLPLLKDTANALRAWLSVRGNAQVPELFVNARRQPLSRWGVAYILNKHVQTAARRKASLREKRVSPHVLRHTCAMLALQATHDIRKVSLWLGHATIRATEIYTRVDPTDKLAAISSMTPPTLRKGSFRPPDRLIALLKGRNLWGVEAGVQPLGARPTPTNSP